MPIQFAGALAIMVWAFATSFAVLKAIDKIIGIRVTAAEELIGFDHSEHGGSACPEFIFQEQVTNVTDF